MKEQRQKEFSELQKKAVAALDMTDSVSADEALILYLSRRPSFDDWISWFISKNDASQYVSKQILWRKVFDFQRFSDPFTGLKYGWRTDPTLETKVFTLDTALFEALLVRVHKIELRPSAKTNIVLDGIEWLLRISGFFDDQMVYWNTEPEAWQDIISWAKTLYTFLVETKQNS